MNCYRITVETTNASNDTFSIDREDYKPCVLQEVFAGFFSIPKDLACLCCNGHRDHVVAGAWHDLVCSKK